MNSRRRRARPLHCATISKNHCLVLSPFARPRTRGPVFALCTVGPGICRCNFLGEHRLTASVPPNFPGATLFYPGGLNSVLRRNGDDTDPISIQQRDFPENLRNFAENLSQRTLSFPSPFDAEHDNKFNCHASATGFVELQSRNRARCTVIQLHTERYQHNLSITRR